MATIVTRSGKGSPLTHAEVDSNFTNLNTDKLELSGGTMTGNLEVQGTVTADGLTVDGLVGIGRSPTSSPYSASEQVQIGDTGVVQSFDVNGYESVYLTENSRWDVTGYEQAIQTSEASKIRLWNGNIHFYLHDSVSAGANQTSWRNALHIESNGDISFYEDTGTTPKLVWKSADERLGIGTSSPSSTATVQGTFAVGNGVSGSINYASGGGLTLGSTSTDPLILRTNSVERMRIDSSGNVGIGVVPSATGGGYKALQLGLMTNWAFPSTGSAYRSHNLYYDGTNRKYVTTGTAHEYEQSSAGHIFSTAASGTAGTNVTLSERMRITSAGSVGVGTTTPEAISGYTVIEARGSSQGGIFTSTTPSGDKARFYVTGTAGYAGTVSNQDFVFLTNDTERMRIDSSGRVGIGRNANSHKLEVDGEIKLTNMSAGEGIDIFDTGSAQIGIKAGGTAGVANMLFETGNSERMRIDSSGNVLVGTTVNSIDTEGALVRSTGQISACVDGSYGAVFQRKTSDGDIAVFRKDGTTVGSIGVVSGDAYIATGDVGLRFDDGNNILRPVNSSGTDVNGTINLGGPNQRFASAYLSGSTIIDRSTSGDAIVLKTGGTERGTIHVGTGGSVTYDSQTDTRFQIGGSEKMRIDSSGNVGIGTSSPLQALHVNSGTGNSAAIFESTDATSQIWLKDSASSSTYQTGIACYGDNLLLNNGGERMRIDSSGNLLVGKTSDDAGASTGVINRANGRVYATVSGGEAAKLNRLSSDGDIVDFLKDGTTVGSIGSASGNRIYIGTGNSTLGFSPVVDAVYGYSGDNTVDLGTSATRFKDLYLAGGVYLGGTGAANKLDDYEEGTWTAQLSDGTNISSTTATGYYTKVGRIVHCMIAQFTNISTSGMSGILRLSLPFTPATGGFYSSGTAVMFSGSFPSNTYALRASIYHGETLGYLQAVGTNGAASLSTSNITSGTTDISQITFSYITA